MVKELTYVHPVQIHPLQTLDLTRSIFYVKLKRNDRFSTTRNVGFERKASSKQANVQHISLFMLICFLCRGNLGQLIVSYISSNYLLSCVTI